MKTLKIIFPILVMLLSCEKEDVNIDIKSNKWVVVKMKSQGEPTFTETRESYVLEFTSDTTYKLKLDCNKYNLDFIKDIKPGYISNIRVVSSTHSKITDYRSDVKVQAIVAAKDKATLLLSCIDEEIGGVLEITEIVQPNNSNPYGYYNNMSLTSNCIVTQPNYSYSELDAILPTLKLRYEIKSKFEIK
jgi:hypothetical protein